MRIPIKVKETGQAEDSSEQALTHNYCYCASGFTTLLAAWYKGT